MHFFISHLFINRSKVGSVRCRGEENLTDGTARAEPAEDDKKEMKRFIIGVSPAYPRLVVSEW